MITIVELEGADEAERYIAAVERGLPRSLSRALTRTGQHAVAALSAAAPRSNQAHDHLADSFYAETLAYGDGVAIDIHSSMPDRLRYVLDGTMAHVIRARPGGVLAFEWANGPRGPGVYFATSVLHPGTQPNDFVARVIDPITAQAAHEIDAALDSLLGTG